MEKPAHADGDQLFHRQPVLCRRAGHPHVSPRQPGRGHHRNMVLWKHALQNRALPSGKMMMIQVPVQVYLAISTIQFIGMRFGMLTQ